MMAHTHRRYSGPGSRFIRNLILLLCASVPLCLNLSSATAQAPVIDSISPSQVVENPVPQPEIIITGSNLRQPGVFDASGNPTVTITHTALPGVSFSVVAGTNFTGTQATIAGNLNHFNMLQMPLGVYDLTLTRPDDASVTVEGGFSLTTQPEPEPGQIEMRVASRWGGPVHGADISEDGTIAYIANGRMFRVLDLSDESSPVEISSLFLGSGSGGVSDVKVKDGYAFIAMGGNQGGFRVVDVSDLAAPDLVWATNYPSAGDNVELWGDYAYVGARSVVGASVRVFDISDPLNVVSHGTISGTSGAKSILIYGNYLCVGHWVENPGSTYLSMYGLSADPISPPEIGGLVLSEDTHDIQSMAAADSHLYMWSLVGVQDEAALLLTVDITNPAEPVITSTIGPQWLDGSMAVGGGLLFVGSGQEGVQIFDLTDDPANPSPIGSYLEYTHIPFANRFGGALAARDERAYLWDAGEGFVLVDVSSPTEPQRIGKYHSPARLGPMARQGDLLYVSDFVGGFTVLDVSDPNAPHVVANYTHQPYDHGYTGSSGFLVDSNKYVQGIALEGERAYITLNSWGLEVIDISDPASPTFLNAFRTPQVTETTCFCDLRCSEFRAITVQNELAHVGFLCSNCSTCTRSSILTLDVSNDNNLSQFSLVEWTSAYATNRIALSQDGETAFGVSGELERYFGNMSSISPFILGTVPPPDTSDIAWHKDVIYVTRDGTADEDRGLWIRDVADPENPVLLATVNSFDRAYAVDVQNDRAYVAGQSPSGLYLLDVSDPANPVELAHAPTGGGSNRSILTDEPQVLVTNYGLASGADGLQILDVLGLSTPTIPGDLNGDGSVGVTDLLILLAAWGDCPPAERGDCPADLDGNGSVGVADLLVLLVNWG